MKPPNTLYLLAAEQDFRLLRGKGLALIEICHHKFDEFEDARHHFASEASHGHTARVSYGVNDRGVHETEQRRRFARRAAEALEVEWAKGKDDRIILAAGPKMLGLLRDALPRATAAHVAADLAKDLVHVPLHDLPDHLTALAGLGLP